MALSNTFFLHSFSVFYALFWEFFCLAWLFRHSAGHLSADQKFACVVCGYLNVGRHLVELPNVVTCRLAVLK